MAERIEKASQYADTPRGWAERWSVEIKAAQKEFEKFHTQGKKTVERFVAEKQQQSEEGDNGLNLLHSNVVTLQSLLYGKTPSVEVARRFADADDDQARVAGESLERLLNMDIERDSDSFADAVENSLEDRLLPGLGMLRMRYVAEFETQEVPAQIETNPDTGEEIELAPAYTQEVKTFEDVESDYYHWRDILWSPGRVWSEVRWIGFRAFLAYEAIESRFGPEIAKHVSLAKGGGSKESENGKGVENDPWARAEIWEIWSKEDKRVYWYSEGCDFILDMKDDPLGLDRFWPCPRPMMANKTTSKCIPRPDYWISRRLYNQIDTLFCRIGLLEEAIKVAGVYDKDSPELAQLVNNSNENTMIAVKNWAAFGEKGGLKGKTDWFPLDMIVGVLDKLSQKLNDKIQLLYQVSGMSDIMRGATNPTETLGAQQLKAKFGSVRVQRIQDDLARFATEAQSIKAEIIAKHFDVKTIIERSNIMQTEDRQYAEQAAQLIKDRFFAYRVTVKPEAVAMTDFAALKAERSEFMQALSSFVPALLQAAKELPGSLPVLMKMLKWVMASFRGSSTVEGILDQAISAAEKMAQQPPPPPKPDPRMQVEQARTQGSLAKTKLEIQGDLALEQEKTKGKVIEQRAQAAFSPQPIIPSSLIPGRMP